MSKISEVVADKYQWRLHLRAVRERMLPEVGEPRPRRVSLVLPYRDRYLLQQVPDHVNSPGFLVNRFPGCPVTVGWHPRQVACWFVQERLGRKIDWPDGELLWTLTHHDGPLEDVYLCLSHGLRPGSYQPSAAVNTRQPVCLVEAMPTGPFFVGTKNVDLLLEQVDQIQEFRRKNS
jgi:hypothetical protein